MMAPVPILHVCLCTQYSFIYHFFGLLWTNQFIIGCSYVTVAGEVNSFLGLEENMPLQARAMVA
jgi:hypothetical protein